MKKILIFGLLLILTISLSYALECQEDCTKGDNIGYVECIGVGGCVDVEIISHHADDDSASCDGVELGKLIPLDSPFCKWDRSAIDFQCDKYTNEDGVRVESYIQLHICDFGCENGLCVDPEWDFACSDFPCEFDAQKITNTWGSVDAPPSYVSAFDYPYEFTIDETKNVIFSFRYHLYSKTPEGPGYVKNYLRVYLDDEEVYVDESEPGNEVEAEPTIDLGKLYAGTYKLRIETQPYGSHFGFDWFKLEEGDGEISDESGPCVTQTEDVFSVDHQIFGEDSLTRDTIQKLDFLDVTLTVDRSYNDISTQFGVDGDFEGFRYATREEVVSLINNFGFTPNAIGGETVHGPNMIDQLSCLVSFFGVTDDGSIRVTRGMSLPVTPTDNVVPHISIYDYPETTGNEDQVRASQLTNKVSTSSTLGSFLVTESTSCTDADSDSYDSSTCGGEDCDDMDASINPGAVEICDNLDNNCDGTVDENCDCVDSQEQSCGSTDVGECVKGTKTCLNGEWSSCSSSIEPVTEICDSLDNDCDGTVDEGCSCTNGQEQICGSTDVGECAKGVQTCITNEWSDCIGDVGPVDEICDDSLDNDCDGLVDEGCEDECEGDDCDDDTDEEEPISGACKPDKVLICHVKGNPHEICVSRFSVNAHLNHGDYGGYCLNPDSTNDNLIDEEINVDETNECDGCKANGACYTYGTRLYYNKVEQYCNINKEFNLQKDEESRCDNDYECLTNSCKNSKCVDLEKQMEEMQEELKETKGLLQKVLAWFKKFGGIFGNLIRFP